MSSAKIADLNSRLEVTDNVHDRPDTNSDTLSATHDHSRTTTSNEAVERYTTPEVGEDEQSGFVEKHAGKNSGAFLRGQSPKTGPFNIENPYIPHHGGLSELPQPAIGHATEENLENLTASRDTIRAQETDKTKLSDTGTIYAKSPPTPPPKDETYLDPTPQTPTVSTVPSRTPSNAGSNPAHSEEIRKSLHSRTASPALSGGEFDEETGKGYQENGPRSEIQNIMDQFDDGAGGPNEHEVLSPRLELAGPFLGGAMQHPPRKSSLEPIRPSIVDNAQEVPIAQQSLEPEPTSARQIQYEAALPPLPLDPSSLTSSSQLNSLNVRPSLPDSLGSPTSSIISHKPQPPEPEPEPDLPFDFHRFLEQLRHRSADPVARYLRSFLAEFSKKQWMVHEQVKIIGDFLIFIANKMEQCEVWNGVSDAEFDNAREGMEKLVMNRLYSQTFSPAIDPPPPIIGAKGKRKQVDRTTGPGRRGQHQEDVERDEVLAQKVQIYGWVQEEHLDITSTGPDGRKFLGLAQQELLKIKGYRAPRDKVICVLNCCKVIFGLLRRSGSDQSADSFVPLLILVVLQSNPEHLVSNVQYILRFRNQDKLGGEAGYYLSSLMGAVQFIENLDRTTLTISDEEFEKNVETAVSAIAEKHKQDEEFSSPAVNYPSYGDKSAPSRPEVTPRNSMEGERTSVRQTLPFRNATDATADSVDEKLAVAGLLRSIQKPLSSIGRMFSEEPATRSGLGLVTPPQRAESPSRASPVPRKQGGNEGQGPKAYEAASLKGQRERRRMNAEDAAARQASAESAEAQRLQQAQHASVIETLLAMFPNLDKDLIEDVVSMKRGDVGRAVDACLALTDPIPDVTL